MLHPFEFHFSASEEARRNLKMPLFIFGKHRRMDALHPLFMNLLFSLIEEKAPFPPFPIQLHLTSRKSKWLSATKSPGVVLVSTVISSCYS